MPELKNQVGRVKQGTNPGDNRTNSDRDGNRGAAKQVSDRKGGRNPGVGHDQKTISRDRGDGRRTEKGPRRA